MDRKRRKVFGFGSLLRLQVCRMDTRRWELRRVFVKLLDRGVRAPLHQLHPRQSVPSGSLSVGRRIGRVAVPRAAAKGDALRLPCISVASRSACSTAHRLTRMSRIRVLSATQSSGNGVFFPGAGVSPQL
jgi:hypothetical protein